jgi:general secretion pathway protein F
MGAYEYHALDSKGKTRKGILEGDAERQVRSLLRDQGLTPLKVTETRKESTEQAKSFFSSFRRLSSRDLTLITRQFATLVKAGLSVEECLNALIEQNESLRVRSVLSGVRGKVIEGHSLARAFAEYPNTFPELYRSLIAAGEQSGNLDIILERLADYTESQQVLKQQIGQAFIYPVIVSTFAFAIIVVLMTYVVPKVSRVFTATGQELPLPTQVMIGISQHLTNYWGWWLLGSFAAIVLARQVLQNESVRYRWHGFLLKVPLVGSLIRSVNAARMASTLGILTSSGIPLLQAMKSAVEVVSNLPMRNALQNTMRQVSEGGSLSRSLGKTRLFPPMVIHLVASGENSGHLDNMLMRASETQSRELESWVKVFTSLLEPVLIVLMGLVVLFIVLSILLPIFEMNQFIH